MNHTRTLPAPGAITRQRSPLSAVLIATAIVCLSSTTAFARDDEHRGRGHNKQGDAYSHGYRHREWRGEDHNYGYRPSYPQPYLYSQPVYVPPPVYYAPRQSPGISLFFPLDLR